MNPKSVTGTALAIMADYSLPVLLAGDARGAAERAGSLTRRC